MSYFNDISCENTDRLCCCDRCKRNYCICCKGERGPKGETGAQGEQGEQGLQGLQGEQGIQGLHGEQGIQGLQGEKGEQGIQGPQGEQGPSGIIPPFEYAFFSSSQQQTIQPESTTSQVNFERRLYVSSGITMSSDGIVTISTPGMYRITYDLFPSVGAGTNTQFTFAFAGSTNYLSGSNTMLRANNTEVTATFLINVPREWSFRVNVRGSNAVTLSPVQRTVARLTISQITHSLTTDVSEMPEIES